MASYMDIFKQDPLAPASELDKYQLPQMSRPAPSPQIRDEESYTEKATGMLADQAVNYGIDKGGEYLSEKAIPYAKSLFSAPTMSSVATPLMKSGVDVGLSNALAAQTTGATMGAGTAAANTAAAGAAGSGAMAALGTAIPYVGLGLLAGKAFGLFNKGGPVYAQEGAPIGPLAIRKIKYKRNGGKITEEFEVSS